MTHVPNGNLCMSYPEWHSTNPRDITTCGPLPYGPSVCVPLGLGPRVVASHTSQFKISNDARTKLQQPNVFYYEGGRGFPEQPNVFYFGEVKVEFQDLDDRTVGETLLRSRTRLLLHVLSQTTRATQLYF